MSTVLNVNPVPGQAIHRVKLMDFLRRQSGRFVTVDFIKLDGSPRILNGRLGVVKYSKGGPNKTAKESNPYLTIFDVQCMGYRTVNLDTVERVRAQHSDYDVLS